MPPDYRELRALLRFSFLLYLEVVYVQLIRDCSGRGQHYCRDIISCVSPLTSAGIEALTGPAM